MNEMVIHVCLPVPNVPSIGFSEIRKMDLVALGNIAPWPVGMMPHFVERTRAILENESFPPVFQFALLPTVL